MMAKKNVKDLKVGLILIGGSLKGIYGHTGVVRSLQHLGIKPSVVLGASAGALIAALYTSGKSMKEMYKMMTILQAKDFLDPVPRHKFFYELVFNKAKNFTGFIIGDQLEKYVRTNLGPKDDFSKCKIPLYIAATNLGTYELQLFNTGKISEAVRASTAIPMMFEPKKIRNDYYIDGAVVKDKLPQALVDTRPDLDLIIISNFSHEPQTVENAYLEDNKLPMLEIVRRVLSMHEHNEWPKKIDTTNIIYLKPAGLIPVDLFHPDKQAARAVYHETSNYTYFHLKKEFKRLGLIYPGGE